MTAVVDPRRTTRSRTWLRDRALDAARATVLERGWGAVRVGAVAAEVGTSRQTLHAEFGTKEELGQALILRETDAFYEAVAQRLTARDDESVTVAVVGAAELALTMVEANSLLQAVLGSTAQDHGLLPLLTSRGEPLVTRGVELFGTWVRLRVPDLDEHEARVMVESVVRLLISHAVGPSTTPRDAACALALVVRRFLGDRA